MISWLRELLLLMCVLAYVNANCSGFTPKTPQELKDSVSSSLAFNDGTTAAYVVDTLLFNSWSVELVDALAEAALVSSTVYQQNTNSWPSNTTLLNQLGNNTAAKNLKALTDLRGYSLNSVGEAVLLSTDGYLLAYAGETTPTLYNYSHHADFNASLAACSGDIVVSSVSTLTYNSKSVNAQNVWLPVISPDNVVVGVLMYSVLQPSKILNYQSWRDDDEAIWSNTLLPIYHRDNPDVYILFSGEYSTFYTEGIVDLLKSGLGADIVTCKPFHVGLYPYVEKLDDHPIDMSNYGATPISVWSHYDEEGGADPSDTHPYCLPLASVLHGNLYNVDLFNELGLTIPTTNDEFRAMCDAVVLNGSYTCLAVGLESQWDVKEITFDQELAGYRQGDVGRAAINSGEASFSDQAYIDTWAWLQEWVSSGYLDDDFENLNYGETLALWTDGKALVLPSGSWSISYFDSLNLDFEYSAFPPTTKPGQSDCYVVSHPDMALAVNSNSDYLTESFEFLDWVNTVEFAELLSNTLTGFFAMNTQPFTIQSAVSNEMNSWLQTCESAIRSGFGEIQYTNDAENIQSWLPQVTVDVMDMSSTPAEAAAKMASMFYFERGILTGDELDHSYDGTLLTLAFVIGVLGSWTSMIVVETAVYGYAIKNNGEAIVFSVLAALTQGGVGMWAVHMLCFSALEISNVDHMYDMSMSLIGLAVALVTCGASVTAMVIGFKVERLDTLFEKKRTVADSSRTGSTALTATPYRETSASVSGGPSNVKVLQPELTFGQRIMKLLTSPYILVATLFTTAGNVGTYMCAFSSIDAQATVTWSTGDLVLLLILTLPWAMLTQVLLFVAKGLLRNAVPFLLALLFFATNQSLMLNTQYSYDASASVDADWSDSAVRLGCIVSSAVVCFLFIGLNVTRLKLSRNVLDTIAKRLQKQIRKQKKTIHEHELAIESLSLENTMQHQNLALINSSSPFIRDYSYAVSQTKNRENGSGRDLAQISKLLQSDESGARFKPIRLINDAEYATAMQIYEDRVAMHATNPSSTPIIRPSEVKSSIPGMPPIKGDNTELAPYGLDDVLAHPVTFSLLKDFYQELHCAEVMACYHDIQIYKSIKSKSVRSSLALRISTFYIAKTAPQMVNISHAERDRIVSDISSGNSSVNVFDSCEASLLRLIKTNHWNAFVKSPRWVLATMILENTRKSRKQLIRLINERKHYVNIDEDVLLDSDNSVDTHSVVSNLPNAQTVHSSGDGDIMGPPGSPTHVALQIRDPLSPTSESKPLVPKDDAKGMP